MAFKRHHIESWVTRQFPGERFLSYVATSTRGGATAGAGGIHSSGSIGGDVERLALAESIGLDPEGRLVVHHEATFWALTDRQLLLGTRSGLRNRPKELLHAAAIDGVRVWWFDSDPEAGNQFRHFLVDFGDGSWRGDRTGLKALGRELTTSNSDEFLQAIGETIGDRLRAVEV